MRMIFATAAAAALALAACEAEEPMEEAEAPAMEEEMASDDMDAVEEDLAEDDMPDDADMVDAGDDGVDTAQLYAVPDGTPDNIRRAVESDTRPDADTDRDAGRMPAEMLTLAGIEDGDRVVEFASFGNYYTRLLIEAVGPEGHVYMYDLPYTERFGAEGGNALSSAHDNVDYELIDYNALELPGDLDAVMNVLYYHDLPINEIDTAALNQKIYDALNPGGVFFVIDHNAPGVTEIDQINEMHRIDPQVIIDEVTAAGFELREQSDLLANPDDDHSQGPFQMRGETDRSVFVFVKPEA